MIRGFTGMSLLDAGGLHLARGLHFNLIGLRDFSCDLNSQHPVNEAYFKWTDVLSQDLVKFWSREMHPLTIPIALEFNCGHSSSAAGQPNLIVQRLHEICRWEVLPWENSGSAQSLYCCQQIWDGMRIQKNT